jgi:hypothetical protein
MLSHDALIVAQAAYESGDAERYRPAASDLFDELVALENELSEWASSVHGRLQLELSEAQLDCRFVLSDGDRSATSLRFGAYLSTE